MKNPSILSAAKSSRFFHAIARPLPRAHRAPLQRPQFSRFILAMTVLCIAGRLGAAEPEDAPLIEVEARFVHVTAKQVLKAFGPSSAPGNLGTALSSDQARKALQTLGEMKADFFSSLRAVSKSGQRASVETAREMRYPTEFTPSKDQPGRLIPTAFETRNVGVTFEFEAFEKDGRINLNVVPKIVRFLGFIDYGPNNAAPAKNGSQVMAELLKRPLKENGIWQPIFSSQQITTSLKMQSGATILVGEMPVDSAAKEAAPDSPRTFVFITARSLHVNVPAGEPHPATP